MYTHNLNIGFRYRVVNGGVLTGSAFGVLATYQTKIKTKLLEMFGEYYRIASADVQSLTVQGSILAASNIIEQQTGMIIIPKTVAIEWTRFPIWQKVMEIPRGPILFDTDVVPLVVSYTQDQTLTYAQTMTYCKDTENPTGTTVARLYTDRTYPFLALCTGQVWPVPIWGDGYPVRIAGTFGVLSPQFFDANTTEDCYINYSVPITALFQLALHLYENRMPVTDKVMSEIPYTLQALITGLTQ